MRLSGHGWSSGRSSGSSIHLESSGPSGRPLVGGGPPKSNRLQLKIGPRQVCFLLEKIGARLSAVSSAFCRTFAEGSKRSRAHQTCHLECLIVTVSLIRILHFLLRNSGHYRSWISHKYLPNSGYCRNREKFDFARLEIFDWEANLQICLRSFLHFILRIELSRG